MYKSAQMIELLDKRDVDAPSIPNSVHESQSSSASNKSWSSTTVFVTQVIIVYVVILCSLLNLTFYPGVRQELWITLLSSSIGYLLPSPSIKKPSNRPANVVD
jgi:hypothetical protein